MNLLLIDATGVCLDFAMRCKAYGHNVRAYIRNNKDGTRSRIGDGLIERVSDWEAHMNWADLIFTTDNTFYIHQLERYRDKGYPIFGTSVDTNRWEQDRQHGASIFEKVGIPVIPSVEFKNYDDAISFVMKNNKRYVSKPLGDGDKALSYVSKSPADMVFMLQKWKKSNAYKGSFILQEFHGGIEIAVGGWVGSNGFSKHFCVNHEFKKLLAGDLGVSTGEEGCYSADTEVLTDSGWKYWPDVVKEDQLATLVDGKLTFETPTEIVSFDKDCEMVQWKNRSIDLLVTKNHNMYVAGQSSARAKNPEWKFVRADECTESQYLLKRTAEWGGVSPETFTLPGNTWSTGIGTTTTPDIVVPFTEWCKFLGIYFAEGSTGINSTHIAQSHPVKFEKVRDLLSAFPIAFKAKDNGFIFHSAQLARVTKPFGRSYEKRVPDYIKNASTSDIIAFLDAFCLGDGSTAANGSRYFYTSNPGLADDLQELMLRCGRLGVIKQLKRKNNLGCIDGRTIYQRRPAYVVYERTKKITGWLDARDRKEVHYTGKVYCATVSSHVLYVRRNGKPAWCGNTILYYTQDSKLANKVLLPLEGMLKGLGYTGYIDVNCIVDDKGNVWPLEFTMRPGWPLFMIQQAVHRGDPCQWMLDLIEGKDTLKVSDKVACGVVVTMPPYPFDKGTPQDEHVGYPMFDLTKEDVTKNVHLAAVEWGSAPAMVDDAVKLKHNQFVTAGNYVCIVTGVGDTVEDAREDCYTRIKKKINVPNSLGYRIDIGCRLEKQLPELRKMGFTDRKY